MILALDFDNCFTLDRGLWRTFIPLAQARGHRVICVTGRSGEYKGYIESLLPEGIEIYYCAHKPKREVMAKYKIEVDVWIDDYPEGIVESAAGHS